MANFKRKIDGCSHQKYKDENGNNIPSVTQILNIINKPFLIKWANDLGLNGKTTEDVSLPLMLSGTLCHKLIENRIENFADAPDIINKIYNPENEEEKTIGQNALNNFVNYLKFVEEKHPFIEAVEKSIIDYKYKFGGTIDAIGSINDENYLFDWKTGKSIYPEYWLQLAAYHHLLKTQNLNKFKYAALVLFPNNKTDYEFHVIDIENLEKLFPIFLSALNIYKFLKEKI